MNSNPPTHEEPAHESETPIAMFGLFIDTPLDITVALCLAAPLRYIFSTALADNLARPALAVPLTNGVYISLPLRDGTAGFEVIDRQLKALGYLPIAHIGRWEPGGWHCLHGSADKVLAFDDMLQASLTEIQFETQIKRAHAAALSKPPT